MGDIGQGEIYQRTIMLMMRSKRHLARAMDQFEMTAAQGMVLLLLEPGKGTPMQKLSCMMGCDASNVTGLVERLDTQGMINQKSDKADRRVKLIELNPNGIKRRKVLLEQLNTAGMKDLEKLSLGEQETFVRLIDKITAKE